MQRTALLAEHDMTRRLRLGTAILRRRWRLRTARSAADAIESARFFTPSLILLDLGMLRLYANRLVDDLRVRAPDAAIVGLVDRGHEPSTDGLDAVLPRPVEIGALYATLDELYAAAEKRAADTPEESGCA